MRIRPTASPAETLSDPPIWPQRFRPGDLFFSIAALSAAALFTSLAFQGVERSEMAYSSGFAGGAALMFSLALIGFRDAGFRYLRRPRGLIVHCDPERGNGLEIPHRRTNTALLLGVLVGAATYGIAGFIGWLFGSDETLLPFGRDSQWGAVLLLSGAVVSIGIATWYLAFRSTTELRLYATGIERRKVQRIPFASRTTTCHIPWDGVAHVEGLGSGHRIGSARRAIIRLHRATPLHGPVETSRDADKMMDIQAHLLAAEPNTLLTLLKRLSENEIDRSRITASDTVELLRPPPLRERFRAARIQKAPR